MSQLDTAEQKEEDCLRLKKSTEMWFVSRCAACVPGGYMLTWLAVAIMPLLLQLQHMGLQPLSL